MLKVLAKYTQPIPSTPLDPAIQTYWKDLFNKPYTGKDMTSMQIGFHRFADRVSDRINGVCIDPSFSTNNCGHMTHSAHFEDEYIASISSYDRFKVSIRLDKTVEKIELPPEEPDEPDNPDEPDPEHPEGSVIIDVSSNASVILVPTNKTGESVEIGGDEELDPDSPSTGDEPSTGDDKPPVEYPDNPVILDGGDVELDPDPPSEYVRYDYENTVSYHITLTALSNDNATQTTICRANTLTYRSSDELSSNAVGSGIISLMVLLFNMVFDAEFEEITKEVYDELNKKDDNMYSSSCGNCDAPCNHGGDNSCGKCTAEVLSSKNEIYLCGNCGLHQTGIRYFNSKTGKIYCPSCTYQLLSQLYPKSACLQHICLCSGVLEQIALIDQIIQENNLKNIWIAMA